MNLYLNCRELKFASSTLLALALLFPALLHAGVPTTTCEGNAANLMFPLDASYQLVDFCGDGATGAGPAVCPDQHNDDDSATVVLPFTFNLYGDLYDAAFVNTNGNLSFGTSFSEFSSTGFPSSGFTMVAPFWADIDTGDAGNPVGDVWMKFFDGDGDGSADTLVVTWENVGYFSQNSDLKNTFQVAISNGNSPLLGIGNNVCFSYDNMCWTTGDASSGVGGFGGVPATAGANRGDGVNFFQIGRYDQAGAAFDGPFGANDGVDSLDGQTLCFSTVTTTNNIAPIATNVPPRGLQIDVDQGQTLSRTISFLSPEQGQITDVVVVDDGGAVAAGLDIQIVSGNVAQVSLQWTPDCSALGVYDIVLEASDDFSTPGVSTATVTLEILCPSATVFLRGDCAVDGSIDIFDTLTLLFYLFQQGAEPSCLASCDANADLALDLIDALHSLTFLFGGGISPAAPFPDCAAGGGNCVDYSACP